jgi:cysteinyl-tRNA synthetase
MNNLDTKNAISHLLQMITKTNKYINQNAKQSSELLAQIEDILYDWLRKFGLKFQDSVAKNSIQDSSKSAYKAWHTLASFRSIVRKSAIKLIKSESSNAEGKTLLNACDEVRKTAAEDDVILEDTGLDTHRIKLR